MSRLTTVDWFGLFNSAVFILLASTSYWHRFLKFKPRANLPEFLAYAAVIFACILVAWRALRRYHFNTSVLVAFELGVLLHFAAGLVYPGSMRLYDLQLGINLFDYPLRFDKVVHAFNAYVGCALALDIFRAIGVKMARGRMLAAGLVVLGVGALIEIVEYLVVKTVPHNGVGNYDNNMTDLLGNLLGCLLFFATRGLLSAAGCRLAFWGLLEASENDLDSEVSSR
jgi:hypothetical protein